MRRPRHLSPDERDLWDSVARRTTPLDGKLKARPILDPAPKHSAPVPAFAMPDPIPHFTVGVKSDPRRPHDLAMGPAAALKALPLRMDHKTHGKMAKGKLQPQSRIDLHGLTLAAAHPALISFILSAHANGLRLVLVITGKGKDRDDGGPIPTRFGVLRHQVPHWLDLPPCRQAILQVIPAHLRHGGQGAYYVYLRKSR